LEQEGHLSLWAALSQRWLRRCLLVGAGLGVCQQIAGVNSVMYYGTEILRQNGLGTQAALVANIANGVRVFFENFYFFLNLFK
jgi:major inositol transporter-like SP family MFS transporter